MAKNYLDRRFTLREIVLLVILLLVVIVGLYFGLVYYPIQARTDELNTEREELQLRHDVAEARKAQYDQMKAALEEINAGEGQLTAMPLYDNNAQQEVLADCFTTIFAGLDVNITYSTPTLSDGIYSRTIQFSFTVSEPGVEASIYERTRSVLENLLHTGFRCLMTTLNLNPIGEDLLNGSISVSTTLVFYERA